MKRKISMALMGVFLAIILVVPIIGAVTGPQRSDILKICNWSEYLGEGVVEDFQAYYKEITGKDITIKYDTFDEPEVLYSKINMAKTDYDVVCPSDYMVEKMIKNKVALPLAGKNDLGVDLNGEPIEDFRGNVSPLFSAEAGFFDYDPSGNYSIPYMWGTMGILYGEDAISLEYLESKGWAALWDTDHKDKIQMKKSLRDTFVAGALYTLKNPASKDYDPNMSIKDALNNTDFNKQIEANLLWQKKNVIKYSGYENDQGKSKVILGEMDMILQWAGDAMYAMTDLQDELQTYRPLNYYIPSEGSNIFSDAWCIPKFAGNKFAANLWMNFMCRSDISIRNMDYIGYTSSIATDETLEYVCGEENEDGVYVPYTTDDYAELDASYFFPASKFGDRVFKLCIEPVQYPDMAIIKKCVSMYDYGEHTQKMETLWNNVMVG
ncbi:MAG: ABC transporter substrate-binding protein [Clostridia bacterium]